ncbi:hypothetical protein, partial [Herbiconiux daphne]
TERNKIVDPALRKQLTLDNINDTLHVNGIKKQDRIQNRETTEEKLKRQAEENRKKRDIIDAEEQAKLDRFRQGAGRNYSKSDLNEAIKATTQGGKALNSDRVINHLTKIADKSNMPGSKEWFKNSVQKMKHVSDADKAGMKSEISKTFANGTPSPNELKTLSNQLGDWESQIHTSNNRKSFADSAKAEAQARNEQMETHGKAVVKANQVSEVHDAMEKAFEGVDVPEYKKSDFIRRHTNKVFKDGEKSQAQQATAIKEATQAAKEYAQRVQRGKPGEPEPAPEQGQGEPTGQPETKAGESTNKPADKEPLPEDEVDE